MEKILDVFGIDWRILIIQIVNFSILLAMLWYLLYRPMLRLIEGRRTQIIEGVAKAERADTALRDADSKRAELITKASLEAEAIVVAAQARGSEKEQSAVAEAEARARRIIAEATAKAEEESRQALARSQDELSKLIVLGVERTLREKTS